MPFIWLPPEDMQNLKTLLGLGASKLTDEQVGLEVAYERIIEVIQMVEAS